MEEAHQSEFQVPPLDNHHEAVIRLTEAQVQALATHGPASLRVVDPSTQKIYVLVPEDAYRLAARIVSGPNRRGWDDAADDDLIAQP